jgi:hypothetical protein
MNILINQGSKKLRKTSNSKISDIKAHRKEKLPLY